MENKNICCENSKEGGVFKGFLLGLLPHSFCIGFILFSAMGATFFASAFKKFLIYPYFFHVLIFLSLAIATISCVLYLRMKKCLCFAGAKKNWKYITTLYSATIITGLIMFFVVFPIMSNIGSAGAMASENESESLIMKIQIPCSGHAPLIIDELKKEKGVGIVRFKMPNIFTINYDPKKIDSEKIWALEIFKIFKAEIKN